ncbi:MAG: 3-phosphoshikimate 1-carboxyvinyltransferase [Acidobacteria bacterium]|nr:3-phosphoshikimate 1-carboxyvinyltransferase [Acidobacteriota bacterium]
MRIEPAKRLRGRLGGLPGDKSVSHRAGLIAALARGTTRVSNYSTSEDCAATLRCLEALGLRLTREGETVTVEGAASSADSLAALRRPDAPLDCGNSGTTMRLLAGVLAGQPFETTLTGDSSLSRRPMRRVIEPLELMGARLGAEDGHAPLRVEGRRPLNPIAYEMAVASAQVKSCVLLAGLFARGTTRVHEPLAATRDHTERMLRWFGVPVESGVAGNIEGAGSEVSSGRVVSVEGGAALTARDIEVPGDISSAAFFVAAAALLPGSALEIAGIGLNPTRAGVLSTLHLLGAEVRAEGVRERCNEPVGEIVVRGGGGGRGGLAPREAGANILSGPLIAQLIDELPVLAVVGTQVEGGLEIRDAGELRVKESDRIGATVRNLRAMGAEVEEFEDGLRVGGPTHLRGARLDAHGDHRIAMAFAVAALAATGASEIEGARECVGVSFPEFFDLLESVTER